MKTISLCMLSTAVILAGGCSSGESYIRVDYDFAKLDKVAIIEVSGEVYGEPAKNQIADMFGMELLKKGYTPVERTQVQNLLKEQELQTSGITSAEGVAKAGQILNVPAVLLVNIPTYKEEMNMTAKIIDVEDGGILWMGSGSGKTSRILSTVAGATAGAAAGAVIAGGDSNDKIAGGVVGGILGGVAGYALSPQQAEKVREIVKKMCKALPTRP